jgi:protein ImuB
MSLFLPGWPIDRLARRVEPSRPCVLAAAVAGRDTVTAVDARAAANGLAPGMPLADARALCPDLALGAADPMGDAAALARLAQWCLRWSPWTAADGADGIRLDVSGCAHLRGGEAELAAEAVERLERRGFRCRAAIADTIGAAWAAARHAPDAVTIVPEGGARAALAPLPVAGLRLEPGVAETLTRLGLRRIGDLYPLPRASLVRRFGAGLPERLDQALGLAREPVSPTRPVPEHWVRHRLAEPICTADAIAAGSSALLAALCARLQREALGVRRLTLSLYRVDGTAAAVAIGTVRASREPRHLERLFAEKLPEIDPGLGIEDMVLEATAVETLAPVQLPLLAGDGAGEALAPLLDRLANRLGPVAVCRPLPRASHVPERAVQFAPAFSPSSPALRWDDAQRRPVRLLPQPEPIEAVAPVPDDPPLLFRWRRVPHRVARADGPERIAGEWWRGPAATRDYYCVEDEAGRRFWLYRDGLYRPDQRPRWFLHGVFA